MILVDANILIYAVNTDAKQHKPAKRWLEETLSGNGELGFAWTVLLAFVRVTTRPAILEKPLQTETALEIVDSWIRQPDALIVHPGRRHWEIFRNLIEMTGTGGNLTMDAHLAALAIEHSAKLCSADYDFMRFPGLLHFNPLKG